MRIAIDARYLNESYSGIAKYSENLLIHISLIDQVNEYVVFTHPGFNRRLRVGPNFQVVPYGARPISTRTLFRFGRRVRRHGCDFLHSLYPVAPLYGVKRHILTVHDLQPFTNQETPYGRRSVRNRMASLFCRATFPHFIRSATWILAVSQATKHQITRLFPDVEEKTIVVHSGVENVFSAAPEPTMVQMVEKRLELPSRYALYIGSAQPNKNVPNMIRAFDRCRREHADRIGDVQFLLVVGRDRHATECRRLVKSLGLIDHVRLLGPVTEEEKHVLYARAALFLFVTRGEGFGFPLLEAQASGVPVIAAADASLPEIAGDSAILVAPDDVDAIAENLCRLLLEDTLHADMVEKGRQNAKGFAWHAAARKTLDIYNLLM